MAVCHMLKLNLDAIGIGHPQLRGSFACRNLRPPDAKIRQNLHETTGIEVVDSHTVGGKIRPRPALCLAYCEEVRSRTNSKNGNVSLLDWCPKELLVELQ